MSEQSNVRVVDAVVGSTDLVKAVGSAEACDEADRGTYGEDNSVDG